MKPENLLTSKKLELTCKRLTSDWQFLRDEIILMTLTKDLSHVLNLENYACLMARNHFINQKKANRISDVDLDCIGENLKEIEFIDESKIELLRAKIDLDLSLKKRFYHALVFVGVVEQGSIRKYVKFSRIKFDEVRKTYNEYVEYLKDYLKDK